MSGDVQPRKRKDKRRKKDDLGVEEPRGTAAVFGEGDVLMHSQHEHGTGGHWCAKIIFFSLLAVLVTLIGLIILENRGLSELEANTVASRYSGVLDGWIEDAPDNDHHDEHTLELKHHSYEDIHDDGDEDDQHNIELEHDEEDDTYEGDIHDNEDNNGSDENDDGSDDLDDVNKDDSEEQRLEEDDDEDDEKIEYKKYYNREVYNDEADDDEEHDKEENNEGNDRIENDQDSAINDSQEEEDDAIDDDSEEYMKKYKDGDDLDDDSYELKTDNGDVDKEDNMSLEQSYNENDVDENYYSDEKDDGNEEADEDEEDEDNIDEEIERIEREDEVSEISVEASNFEDDGDDDNDKATENEETQEDEYEDENAFEAEAVTEPPVVEHITVPSGRPFVELEDEPSSENPTDTLAEEEEYEKEQEQLRLQKQEASSQVWLKLVVGGALLVATHAVIRRSTTPRDTSEIENNATREEEGVSLIDRRMTLIPKESTPLLPQETYEHVREETVKRVVTDSKAVQSVPLITKQESDEDLENTQKFIKEETIHGEVTQDVLDKELYSDDDDEEVDDEEEILDEDKEFSKEDKPAVVKNVDDSEPEEIADDVEIIDDEQIEEEEDEDEEDISDVDDAELLSRLEAKYGRLPEPHRPGQQKHKDGGNNVEDEWPGEPSDQYWRQQLDLAEQDIRQGEWSAANNRLSAAELTGSGRARFLAARSLDTEAEERRDNKLLMRAIHAYLQLLKMNERLSDRKLLEISTRTLDRIKFRGNYLSAEPVYRLLIHRFPKDVSYRNNLTISLLMANRADLAADVLKETLKLWPDDRIALAHYGFVLKTHYNKLEESVTLFRKALDNDTGPACEPRFYYHLGDALLLLGRFEEARDIHKRGAKYGHFLSPAQRSLYNVERLKSRPWWRIEDTPYAKLAQALEKSWKGILKEGEAARALYEKEKEGLKEKGDWSQLDIFVRGQEIPGRCSRAPITCSIVKAETAAANCRRGQIKFSSMEPGTHVRPHVGPTNCRLRMHLGLSNTKDTYIRVDQEIRQWQMGKVLLFDDSFEHEVWHNGTGTRLVLIVDVWHPDLTATERRQLPAI